MRDSWVGLQAGVDARGWARLLRRAHDSAVNGGHVPAIVREVIAASWQRCSETGVDPAEPGAPLVIDPEDAGERWREHSEQISFSPGHAWSERAAGTNAVGTALAADHAVQVFSAEHYRSEVHGWQCSGAPVHDPETGNMLGAIDVTGTYETAHPHNLALVQLAARLAEQELRTEMLERDARILGLFAEHAAHHGGPAAALSPSGRVLAAGRADRRIPGRRAESRSLPTPPRWRCTTAPKLPSISWARARSCCPVGRRARVRGPRRAGSSCWARTARR